MKITFLAKDASRPLLWCSSVWILMFGEVLVVMKIQLKYFKCFFFFSFGLLQKIKTELHTVVHGFSKTSFTFRPLTNKLLPEQTLWQCQHKSKKLMGALETFWIKEQGLTDERMKPPSDVFWLWPSCDSKLRPNEVLLLNLSETFKWNISPFENFLPLSSWQRYEWRWKQQVCLGSGRVDTGVMSELCPDSSW